MLTRKERGRIPVQTRGARPFFVPAGCLESPHDLKSKRSRLTREHSALCRRQLSRKMWTSKSGSVCFTHPVLRKALVVGFDNKITLVWVALLARSRSPSMRTRAIDSKGCFAGIHRHCKNFVTKWFRAQWIEGDLVKCELLCERCKRIAREWPQHLLWKCFGGSFLFSPKIDKKRFVALHLMVVSSLMVVELKQRFPKYSLVSPFSSKFFSCRVTKSGSGEWSKWNSQWRKHHHFPIFRPRPFWKLHVFICIESDTYGLIVCWPLFQDAAFFIEMHWLVKKV